MHGALVLVGKCMGWCGVWLSCILQSASGRFLSKRKASWSHTAGHGPLSILQSKKLHILCCHLTADCSSPHIAGVLVLIVLVHSVSLGKLLIILNDNDYIKMFFFSLGTLTSITASQVERKW